MSENSNPNNNSNNLNIGNIGSEKSKKSNEEQNKYSFSLSNKSIQRKIINNEKKNKEIERKKSLKKGRILGGQFILGEEIGKGTFGVVRVATHIITGEKVAVKILYKNRIKEENDKKRLEKEIKILKILRHNNIVQLYNVFQTEHNIFLVMEYIQGKELFEIIVKKRRLTEIESLFYFQQLISGIEYISKLGIAHRDLKPENLLISPKKLLKIADFGLSNYSKNNEYLSTPCGSPSYAAPEMLSGQKYSGVKADLWSSGVILYTMICGRLPFEDKNNKKLYEKIKSGKFNIPSYVSDGARDFLEKILTVDPNKRINIPDIKKHPWFNMLEKNKFMSYGLLVNKYVIPIDEEIVEKMKKDYEYNDKEVRMNILANKHNHISTTYYLFLKQKIKNGKHSIADMVHSEYINYIKNPKNLLANYKDDWNKIFKERAGIGRKKNGNKIDINDNNVNDNKKNNENIIFIKKEQSEEILFKNNEKEKPNNNNDDINMKNKTIENYDIENIDNKLENQNDKINKITKLEIDNERNNKNEINISLKNNSENKEIKKNVITINLEEIKQKKKNNNITTISPKKTTLKNYINKNRRNTYAYSQTISFKNKNRNNSINTSKFNNKSELNKKSNFIIPKYKNKMQSVISEKRNNIKRKKFSIQIKNISIDTKHLENKKLNSISNNYKLKNTLSYAEAKYKKIIMNKKNKNKDIKKQKNNSVSYNNIDGNKTHNIKNDDNNKIYDKFINK